MTRERDLRIGNVGFWIGIVLMMVAAGLAYRSGTTWLVVVDLVIAVVLVVFWFWIRRRRRETERELRRLIGNGSPWI